MFVHITNGRSSKKIRAVNTLSPKKSFGLEKEEMGTLDVGRQEGPPKTEDETVIDLSPSSQSVVVASHSSDDIHPNPTSKPSKSEKMLGKISEKASRFLPGKLFHGSEKEPELPAIYTLDRDMGRTNLAFQGDGKMKSPKRSYRSPTREVAEIDTFPRSELTSRLRMTCTSTDVVSSLANSGKKSVCLQASTYPPYRLFFVPPEDYKDPDMPAITLTRVLLCECCIAGFLVLWIVFGAVVFYLTEGPYESDQITEFKNKEKDIIYTLATDLRLIAPENNTDWLGAITKYTVIHGNAVRESVSNRYGCQEPFWTFPGSLMFCVSLLTTLGLAAPLPMTIGGQVGALIFTLLGFPVHVFLLLNLGRTIAVKTQILAKHLENHFGDIKERIINVRRFGEDLPRDGSEIWPEKMFLVDFQPPCWLCYFPLVSSFVYYLLGFLIFGVARGMPFPRIVTFFVDFSSLTGSTNGMTRIGFTWYLEGAAILAFVNSIIYSDSPFEGITPVGTKFGFMTNNLD